MHPVPHLLKNLFSMAPIVEARDIDIVNETLGRQLDTVWRERFIPLGREGVPDHIVGPSEPDINNVLRDELVVAPSAVLELASRA
jgi:hypothetical protein